MEGPSAMEGVEDTQTWIERAQECMNQIPEDVEGAINCYSAALQLAPSDPNILELFGEFLCIQGCVDEAKDLLIKATMRRPMCKPATLFYLGQMSHGREALNYYRDGLAREHEDTKESKDARISAYCSIAELYMTDLCDEDEAQESVEEAVQESLRLDPKSIEALVVAGQYTKVIGEIETSQGHLRTAVETLKTMEDDRPGAEIRNGLCKQLIDLNMTAEVQPLLQELLEEDEEDIDALYMVCCAHLADSDVDAVEECFEKAVNICKRNPELQEIWGDILNAFNDGPLAELRKRENDIQAGA